MSITVLLADDHTILREGLRFLLEEQKDIRVIGDVGGGHEAVLAAERLAPDIVIMDITMPDMNGVEATRQICESCLSCRVIVLSMHSTTEHVYQALQAGARGYLLKESAGVELVNAVRMVHAGHRYFSQKISDGIVDGYVQQRIALEGKSPLERLSPRERRVLQLVVEGRTSAEIAEMLFLSPKTVDTYRSRMMQKLGVTDLPTLVKFAIRHGLTSLE